MLLNGGEIDGRRYLSKETCQLFTTSVSKISPVSYTHLDVYKRQVHIGIENDLEHHPGMVRAAAAFLIQLPETFKEMCIRDSFETSSELEPGC